MKPMTQDQLLEEIQKAYESGFLDGMKHIGILPGENDKSLAAEYALEYIEMYNQ